MASHGSQITKPKPLQRLVSFLRPEAGDIGILAVFALVVGVLSLGTPIAVEAIVNAVAFERYMQPLVVLTIILSTLLGFAALLKGIQVYVAEMIQRRIFVRVVADLATRLPRVRRDGFAGHHAPELLNRFFEVVTVQKAAALLVLDGMTIVISTTVGMAVLAFYHPYLLGFDLVLLAATAFMVLILGRGAVRTAIHESYQKYTIAAWLEQLVLAPVAFKLPGASQLALATADDLTLSYVVAREQHFAVLMRQIAFTLGLQAVAAAALLGLGGFLVMHGQLTLGQLVASELIVGVIVGSSAKLGKHLESFYDLLASIDKLGALFDLPLERESGSPVAEADCGARVVLHEVALSDAGGRESFSPLTLQIEPGEVVAIGGPAGCGKSALLESLYALREPRTGYIDYDGMDLRSLSVDGLRSQVALVHRTEVVEGTIADNVLLARPSLTPAAIRTALEAVELWDEVMRLPKGLETPLTPSGEPLSDTQLVRLMLARAIAGRPRLLLIDSLLDQLPDSQLRRMLDAVAGGDSERTVILVTGRDALRAQCDRVVLLRPLDAHSADPGESAAGEPSAPTLQLVVR
jgi:ABC-type bacteriocin/lantibiotic exporter with double-glycine peptidase domain